MKWTKPENFASPKTKQNKELRNATKEKVQKIRQEREKPDSRTAQKFPEKD